MKIPISLLLILFVSSSCHALSIRSLSELASSIFHWKTPQNEVDENRDCTVQRFNSVDKIDTTKMSGDWYEIGRTITKMPIFSSSVWRFNNHDNPDQDAFKYTGKLENGHCVPFSGSAISSNTNPGTFVLVYDGLKSKVEEELKVIYVDYANAMILYGCRRLTSTGTCLPDATFVALLSRHKQLLAEVLDPVYEAIQALCIDPHTLLPQNTSNDCSFADSADMEWKQTSGDQVCLKPAACTIACPKCCEEDTEGCISCDCGLTESADCKSDPTKCDGGCFLIEKSPGCLGCNCPPIMAAPRAPEADLTVRKIESYNECPTACRTYKISDELFCNCSNEKICQHPMPHVNCQGKEERYSFDPRTGTCPAYLGSCENAINSFASVKECLATCSDVCELHPDPGVCLNNEIRYYYNRVQGKCTTFIYGDCGGNDNNYQTLKECELRCPTMFSDNLNLDNLNDFCHEKEDKGNCNQTVLRYAYILEADTCVPFHYGGCGGNKNNFASVAECKEKCNRKLSHSTDGICQVLNCDNDCKTKYSEATNCLECDCTGSANAISASLSGFFAFLIFMWAAY